LRGWLAFRRLPLAVRRRTSFGRHSQSLIKTATPLQRTCLPAKLSILQIGGPDLPFLGRHFSEHEDLGYIFKKVALRWLTQYGPDARILNVNPVNSH